ncbi:MAG: hypothetical protein US69_C0027G0011 [candidate division TM6 bacterium GW2011_GWF2_38_10]|nr:MAG: hypothetical protein US69_C0027G0011 [candidate division TM6 bacterium GW2011_GWF2_38_10]
MVFRRLREYVRFLKSLFRTTRRLCWGMWKLTSLPQPAITIFGGARVQLDSELAKKAEQLALLLARDGFSIITGGGPGIMEAANMGAFNAIKDCVIDGAHCAVREVSAGIGLVRLNRERVNPFVQKNIIMEHFFARKWLLVRYSVGFIVFPGGFGTLDELFETLTLIQCNRMARVPVVLFDSTFWNPISVWIEQQALARGLLSQEDAALVIITDSIAEAFSVIKQGATGQKKSVLHDETTVKE